MNKIPIGIKSCAKNIERQNACRNTWVGCLDKDKYLPLFLIARPGIPSEIIDDILYLDCDDHYQALTGKLKSYYAWALDNTEASHFWTCDDDSYINCTIFNTFEEYKNYDYIGSFIYGQNKIPNQKSGYTSGCGVCISREASNICCTYLPHSSPEYDDVTLGDILNERMIECKKFDPHTINPWSYCTYHPTLMIGHYIYKGAGSLPSIAESMQKMHNFYHK